jgi:hypothetical protein
MRFDMLPHIVSTPGWLPNPPARDVGLLLLLLPDTPDVIRLSSSTPSNSSDSHCDLMNLEIIEASCFAAGLPSCSSFSLVTPRGSPSHLARG